jgi:hypothetical protein
MPDAVIQTACHECLPHHAAIVEACYNLRESDWARRSHYIDGRYENLYLEHARIPELQSVLNTIHDIAANHLGQERDTLKLGFWFNLMQPGQSTSLHSHDDNDELLTGVYYLDVPPDSGELEIHHGGQIESITPRAGMLVMFSPELPHQVSVNNSKAARLSLAFNVGPA